MKLLTGVKRTESFRAEWGDHPDTQRWLRDELFIGETLNFPCGSSRLGNLRVDADPEMNPDVVARLEDHPFKPRSFDTVYCDPPFLNWSESSWIMDLWRVARERFICQTGLQKITIPRSDLTFYVNRPRGPGFSLKVFQIFDRRDRRLEEWSE